MRGVGLAVYNQSTKQLSYPGSNVEKQAAIEEFQSPPSVNYLLFDKKGRLWFSSFDTSYSYVYCYDFPLKQVLFKAHDFIPVFKGFYDITGFMLQKDGTVWFSGFKILGRYLEKDKRFEITLTGGTHEKTIDYRLITVLSEDRENNIWVGTGNNGIFRFNPAQEFFKNIAHLNRHTGKQGDGSPISFFRDRDGTMLVGTWNDGIYRYDSNFHMIPLHIKGIPENNDEYVYDMWPMADSSTVWFASQPGICIYDQRRRQARHINPAAFKNETVREIAQDKCGNVWIGLYHNGIVKWNKEKGEKNLDAGFSRYEPIPRVQILSIVVDKSGFVWVATQEAGLYVIDPANDRIVYHFDSKAPPGLNISEEKVTTLLPYNDSIMTIGTASHIFFFDHKRKKLSEVAKGLMFAGEVSSMQRDRHGRLWVGTTAGLYRVMPNSKLMLSFDRNNGIINDYFIASACYRFPNDRMAFGTSGEIVVFNTDEVKIPATHPDIALTGFHLINRSLPVDSVMRLKQLELAPSDNSLTIDFSTLSYGDNFVVYYQLEGLDKAMRQTNEKQPLIYSYIPPGKYSLRFWTLNSEGVIKQNTAAITIRVNAPFWQTWWFFSIIFLILISLVYWLDRQRAQRVRQEQQMRVSIADNLHEDINTTLRNINVLSEIAAMKSVSEPEQAKEYLKDIQRKSRTMVVAMNDMLWSIDPANDGMDKSIGRLHEIAAEISSESNTEIQVQSSGNVASTRMNMKTRLELISVYKQILHLLVQRAGARETLVQLDCESHVFVLKIFSSNIQLQRTDGSIENNIRQIKKRLNEINGTLNIDTSLHGTDFTLRLRV